MNWPRIRFRAMCAFVIFAALYFIGIVLSAWPLIREVAR